MESIVKEFVFGMRWCIKVGERENELIEEGVPRKNTFFT